MCAAAVFVVLSSVAAVMPRAALADDPEADGFDAARLRAELLYGASSETAGTEARMQKRSIPLAFALSAAVPGLGQGYNRQWIKAAAGLAVEAALILSYTYYQGRGLDEEVAYQAYAHRYWSPARYARYLNDFKDYLASEGIKTITAADIVPPENVDLTSPEAWTVAERQAVRRFFEEIHAVERAAVHPETGASFSHTLPHFGEQQYYELIGKYFQFAPGWEDYPAWKEGDRFTKAIDPELSGPDGGKPNVQGRFWAYAQDHAHSNDLLRRASHISGMLLLNHLVAAIDAAVFAKLHNDRIDTHVRLSYDALGEPQPMASMRVRF